MDLDKVPVGIAHEAVVDAKTLIGIRAIDAVPGRAQSVCPVIYIISDECENHPAGFRHSVVAHPDVGVGCHAIDQARTLVTDEFEVEHVSVEGSRSVELADVHKRDLSVEG